MPYIDKIKVDGIDYDVGNNIEETLPVGTRVEFNGQAQNIPDGWQQVEDERDVYSTTERRIGTWIDGKPIYRYVEEITEPITTQGQEHQIQYQLNIDNLITIKTMLKSAEYEEWYPLPYYYINASGTNSSDWTGGFSFKSDSNKLSIKMGSALMNYSRFFIILEYTKTTDTVGGEE